MTDRKAGLPEAARFDSFFGGMVRPERSEGEAGRKGDAGENKKMLIGLTQEKL